MISETEYTRAIAEFVNEKGVTRCPTVCVAPTRASVSDADRIALRSHAELREAVRQARRREMQRIIAPRSTSRDDGAAVAGLSVSVPHSAACVSP